MKEAHIVRRLRAYENETGPVTLRGLRDDAASEIIWLRIGLLVVGAAPWLLFLWRWTGGELWICK